MTVSFTSPPAATELSSSSRAKRTSRPMCRSVAVSFLFASSGMSFLHEVHHPSGSTCLAGHALPHWMHSLEHSSALALTHHRPLVVWYPSPTKSSAPIRNRSYLSSRVLRKAIMLVQPSSLSEYSLASNEVLSWHSHSRPEPSSLSILSLGESIIHLNTAACESSTALFSSRWSSGGINVACVPTVHLVPILWYGHQ